jgi:hypothetical protein
MELVAQAGYCHHPIRLAGRVEHADRLTGEVRTVYDSDREPDGVLLKACGTRRESRCPSCAAVYRADAYQLLAAGLKGGKASPRAWQGIPGCSSPSPPPASAGSTPARPMAVWCCPVTRTGRAPAAPTASRWAAGTAMTRTILGWGSRYARPAMTPRRRCFGTPWRRSCGDGPPSPSTVSLVAWPARRSGSCVGWSGSATPRWPSSSGAGRSTSMPSSVWTRPPTAAVLAAWPHPPAIHGRSPRGRPSPGRLGRPGAVPTAARRRTRSVRPLGRAIVRPQHHRG